LGESRKLRNGSADPKDQQYITIQLISLIVAGVVVYFCLPYFPVITGIPMSSLSLDVVSVGLPAIGFFVTGIFISCIYPSLLLLKIDLPSSLKGKLAGSIDKISARKTLVIFQFASALTLTSLLIVVSRQIDLMRTTDLTLPTILRMRTR
jgi:putative ABC transport system permease protein